MPDVIKSGDSGNVAIVNDEGRVLTDSIAKTDLGHAAQSGKTFALTTDFISLTTLGSYSGIIYIKNTDTVYIEIGVLRACGTTLSQWKIYKNPTTGTLISGGAAITPVNTNFISGVSLSVTAVKGADARTVTDGTLLGQWVCAADNCEFILDGAIILAPNNSIALVCKPFAAGEFCAWLLFKKEDA